MAQDGPEDVVEAMQFFCGAGSNPLLPQDSQPEPKPGTARRFEADPDAVLKDIMIAGKWAAAPEFSPGKLPLRNVRVC